jgi:hypothetical protein
VRSLNFQIRFLLAGILNYLVAMLIFSLSWFLLNSFTSYLVISCLTTVTSILFSLTIHKKITLSRSHVSRVNSILYYFFHLFQFSTSLIFVPRLSVDLDIALPFIQYMWSAVASVLGVILLKTPFRK